MNKKIILTIYTDGACSGNPGPGGWGVLLQYGSKEKTLKGGDPNTTNNRMEMMAAIKAIEAVNETYTGEIILWTDSTYVMKGITEWVHGWKKKNWIKSDKKPVVNTDLWKVLDKLNSQKNIQWNWVKGHAGVEGNERADELARQGLEEIRS
ncbi:ribonuclease HI [Hellea sp.]|nr:ribonuclease HI [Hellea sp.]MBT3592844.1 ribonuclease HI [Hellea sp.]MBT7398049.1 ribonuclease HI [Hellea sp.]MDA8888172.1 ribonuclease HI [Hellea sp.]MDB4844047.1 ribonuclease HI [Hellea sp.]MDC0650913.1 ribonuclease HI [Hellea sp.]